jgi:hypothetical protein
MTSLSREFVTRVFTARTPNCELAGMAGISPALFSKYLHGRERVRFGHEGILFIARMLGLADGDVFVRPDSAALQAVR